MLCLIDGDCLTHRVGFALKKESNPDNFYRYNIDKYINTILTTLKSGEYKIFISGEYNFRFDACKKWSFLDYKGKRRDMARPPMYNEIREYLKIVYKAKEAVNQESDDCLGIAQFQAEKDTTCICADDKDLLMIPGHHYNIRTGKITYITDDQAWRNFYKQVLTGDWQVDNVPGIRGLGPKTAEKILKDCTTSAEKKHKVLQTYRDRVEWRGLSSMPSISLNSGLHHIAMNRWDKGGIDDLVETLMSLLWIRRGDDYQDAFYEDEKDAEDWEYEHGGKN